MAKNLAPGADSVGSYKGDPAVNMSGAPSKNVIMQPRHNVAAGDPAYLPHMARRQVPQERLGASFAVQVNALATVDPNIAPTQANGRILNPATFRSNSLSFAEGTDDYQD